MSDVLLKILSALGVLLLILLTAAVAALLLVLFFPVTYGISGEKNTKETALSVKMNWLFGLLRLRYGYPRPQLLTIKLLCFKLFEMRLPPDNEGKKDAKEAEASSETEAEASETEAEASVTETSSNNENEGAETGKEAKDKKKEVSRHIEASHPNEASRHKETAESPKTGKISKIKYTILEMYDKIKKMWENISYYLSILQEEDTKQLTGKAGKLLVKILKSIRPRHIKADILFGTGEPDTTGYVYGAYCMLLPFCGLQFLITPDFEQKIFQGEFKASGHIIVYVVLINVLKAAFDKRLHLLIKKFKKIK